MPPAPKRRLFRFSLRTFFVLVAIAAIAVSWFLWNVQQVANRKALLAYIEQQGGYSMNEPLKPWKQVPVLWGWLGAEPVGEIYLQRSKFALDDRDYVARMFPEASVFYVEVD